MLSRSLRAALCCVLLGNAPIGLFQSARACGPDFPNAYLTYSPEELAKLPTLSFAAELARLVPPGSIVPSRGTVENPAQPSVGELAEIREALHRAGVDRPELETLLAHYQRTEPGNQLPQEFHLYAAGAQAWHAGRTSEALNNWRALLALPEGARHYRTTWACYMIGRALWDSDAKTAREAFQATREAAAKHFADCDDLASASLGWEARINLAQEDYASALRLYSRQYFAGDPSALISEELTLQRLFGPTDPSPSINSSLESIANEPLLRGIVTAWFVSRGGPRAPWSFRATLQFRRWLTALPKAASLPPTEAERWAWAAYQNGLWTEADQFAQRSPAASPASEWVRAMLRLRAGDVQGATEHLAQAAHGFPQDAGLEDETYKTDERRFASTGEDLPLAALRGLRGTLALQRSQFIEALRLFLQGGHWVDAAYVAERVLTIEELTTFVQQEVPTQSKAQAPTPDEDSTWQPYGNPNNALRHLLARRLVRASRFDQAREYFPAELTATYDRYVAFIRDGYREENARPLRGLALWQAAQIAHASGMEIQGTELAPDFAIWNGDFQWPDISRVRLTDHDSQWTWYERKN